MQDTRVAGDHFAHNIVQPGLLDFASHPNLLQHSEIELGNVERNLSAPRSIPDDGLDDPATNPIKQRKSEPSTLQPLDNSHNEYHNLQEPSCESDILPMSRRTRSSQKFNPESPGLDVTNKQQGGYTNGQIADDSMEKHLEMRRKHPMLDTPSSESQAAHLMGREGFSLDHDVPPTPSTPAPTNSSFFDLPVQDRRNFLLLVLLYFLQGIPMGLATGSVPFLLKDHLSYGQIGVFSLASYPYSLKLLWSPIVDAVWSPKLGRRKSWILPIQICSGFGLIYLGTMVEGLLLAASKGDGSGVWSFTWWWFMLVLMCATQDIAVDGWALTLISPPNLSYASTAQTVGLTGGHFLSFTVFLAMETPDFANNYLRKVSIDKGVWTLGGYLVFWGWAYLIVTLGLAVLKREERTKEREGIWEVYQSMIGILKLKNIQSIIVIHLIAKIGFQANDAVTNLKLIDKGFSHDQMALTVLIDFPFEIGLGYYAGRWSTAHPPLHVWSYAFIGRLIAAMVAQGVVMIFPAQGVQPWYLLTVIGSHIFSTFSSTVMFVAISAFHAKIADPVIGGTYMTLLAT